MKHYIILINGKRRSGKGILSSALKDQIQKFSSNVYIFSFAESIRKAAEDIIQKLNWEKEPKETTRPLLIAIGDVGRKIDSDFWSIKLFEQIQEKINLAEQNNQDSYYIIDDLRITNELNFFKKNEILFNQENSSSELNVISIRIQKYLDASNFIHGTDDNITETSFDDVVYSSFDYIIEGNVIVQKEGLAEFDQVKIQAKKIIEKFL
ncbi:hypothetical protein [Mycoplasmopsis synoviae]|uniref:Phosphomevalonate kinase n=2 Tax=Mycoplasmopsis synoviae TaxID=2109 RepID=A0AAN1EDY7_MYCSY|nr:hypothetical protein [Mycoplasmopsis synoviae]AKB11141.1 hypothetical protein VY93_02175 [Mycoplasmopsis synoviae ATCC 25204]AKJ20625.1 hypothetical protein MSHv_01480 [Mycoplasmopsis synoviae]AQU47945.1 hypothetical protein ADF19_01480 [Mycoplasmopsis synoviae]AWL84192.1 hypothetical protein MSH_02045 [Mycoplasmopsis synoviae]QGL44963.1 hypothetical protein EJ916_00270 [Mycoplasmopsis synoviae]